MKIWLLKIVLFMAVLLWHDFCHLWTSRKFYFMVPIVILIAVFAFIKALYAKEIYKAGVWFWVFFYTAVNLIYVYLF
ncbi:MAG: hypothetical protein P9L96_02160 [Candidatus Gygaella obscura]|nr:hypothetical protein [Candidatus Gygaella obscura]